MSIDNFAKLQDLFLNDRRLAIELSEIESIEDFAQKLVEISQLVNLPIVKEHVRTAANAGRTNNKLIAWPTPFLNCYDWAPSRLARIDDRLMVEWYHIGIDRFTEPFFEDSIRKRYRKPFGRVFRPVTEFETLGDLPTGIPPTGFIFHMSRCGSTLVSQMLAALDSNIVIAEAPPIDDALSLVSNVVSESQRSSSELLRLVINALGRKRFPHETRFFIKFDSWAILDLDVIQKAFPETPWIFLYRDPLEVIVSHMRQPGMQMVPGLVRAFKHLNGGGFQNSSREEFCSSVLERICTSALRHARTGKGMFVDYRELPFGFERIADHFGAQFTSNEMETMLRVTEFNAKTPQLFFSPDSESKRREATPETQRAAEPLMPLYDQLRSLSAPDENHYDQVA